MASTKQAKAGLARLARRLPREADQSPRPKGKVPEEDRRLHVDVADRLEQIAIRLPAELVDRLRRAAYYEPGMTLTGVVERAVRAELERVGDKPPIPSGRHVRRGRPFRS